MTWDINPSRIEAACKSWITEDARPFGEGEISRDDNRGALVQPADQGEQRAKAVRAAAADLGIELAPLPGYSPDLMPIEALWHWLREDLTYHHCHPTAGDLTRRVAAFEARINQDPCTIADRLWVKHHLDQSEEKLQLSK